MTATSQKPKLRDFAGRQFTRTFDGSAGEIRAIEDAGEGNEREFELSFSSEHPVRRFFGLEVLSHSPGDVDLSRLNNRASVVWNHDGNVLVGGVRRAWLDEESRKTRAVVRFSRSQFAEDRMQDLLDDILPNVSLGYELSEEPEDVSVAEDGETFTFRNWRPYELSFAPIAADPTVGQGRAITVDSESESLDPARLIMAAATQTEDQAAAQAADFQRQLQEGIAAARQEEQKRSGDITALCQRFNHPEIAPELIASEGGLESAQARILDLVEKDKAQPAKVDQRQQDVPENFKPVSAGAAELGMTEGERQRFSWSKLILAQAWPETRSFQENAAFELECVSEEIKRRGKDQVSRGLPVPQDILVRPNPRILDHVTGRRALEVGTATAGGNLVSDDLLSGSFIELLRNSLSIMRAGGQMLPGLTNNVFIPRASGAAQAFWVAEGDDVGEGEPTFDQVPLAPHTVGGFTEYTRQLLLQSSIDIDAYVQMDLSRVVAIEIDRAALNGSGVGAEPTGLKNTLGVQEQDFVAAAPTWPEVVAMRTKVAAANALFGSLAWMSDPGVLGGLMTTTKDAGSGQFIYDVNNRVAGYGLIESTQVETDDLWMGNWADFIIGLWGGLDLLSNPYSKDKSGTVRVTAHQTVDYAVRHPVSFCRGNAAIA